jgi:hypothetical protein
MPLLVDILETTRNKKSEFVIALSHFTMGLVNSVD